MIDDDNIIAILLCISKADSLLLSPVKGKLVQN